MVYGKMPKWFSWLGRIFERVQKSLFAANKRRWSRFDDQLLLQAELHAFGCRGFISLCKAYLSFIQQDYPLAFVHVSRSIDHYKESKQALNHAEHGKWVNFYRADWLTNIDSTIYSLEALRKYSKDAGRQSGFLLMVQAILDAGNGKIHLSGKYPSKSTVR